MKVINLKTKCILIKLRPNSIDRVTEWANTLNQRSGEVFETLTNEGVSLESAFLANINDDHYLVYIMRAEDFDKAKSVAKRSESTIDDYHRKFKLDTWLERTELTNLIDFSM